MKIKIRHVGAVLMVVALFAVNTLCMFAANQQSSTELYLPAGDQASIQFRNGADSFFDFSGVIPGDRLTQYISIENGRAESVMFYLNGASPSDNTELLQEISLRITNTNNNRTIYTGNLTGRPASVYGDDLFKNSTTQINGINLGTYGAYQTANLLVEIDVPVRIDNDFADAISSVTWVVRAELPDPDTTSSSSSSTISVISSSSSSSSSSTPTVENRRTGTNSTRDADNDPDAYYVITDDDVPLAGEPYKIADNQVPLASLPQTGGSLIYSLGLGAACVGGSLVIGGNRHRNNKK